MGEHCCHCNMAAEHLQATDREEGQMLGHGLPSVACGFLSARVILPGTVGSKLQHKPSYSHDSQGAGARALALAVSRRW